MKRLLLIILLSGCNDIVLTSKEQAMYNQIMAMERKIKDLELVVCNNSSKAKFCSPVGTTGVMTIYKDCNNK